MQGRPAALDWSFESAFSTLRVISQQSAIHELIHRTLSLLSDLMNALAKSSQDDDLRFSPRLFLSGLKSHKLDSIQIDRQKRIVDRSRQFSHVTRFFASSSLVDMTADHVEIYLRDRLRQRVRIKSSIGFREKGVLQPATVHQEFRVLRRVLNVGVRKRLLPANPCSGVEFPVGVKGLFRPHYVSWSEQKRIELHAQPHLRNIVRIITETGLRVYKELMSMKKDQLDLPNAVVWIPDSKTPNGIAEVPLTLHAVDAFRDQLSIAGDGPFLFPSDLNPTGHQVELKTVWQKSLRRAKVPYFRIYDLRSTYATRLSAGGVADEWVTQLLRQGDSQVFKRYSQMKLQMKREALEKINRQANEMPLDSGTAMVQ